MPFTPYGKKAAEKRRRAARREEREAAIDRAIGAARSAITGFGLCLPLCVLAERILELVLPPPRFSLRLGSLRVHPMSGDPEPLIFDPRGLEAPGGAFHAWLEDPHRQILDPSVFMTLAEHGCRVERDSYLLVQRGAAERSFFEHQGLRFDYEELPELELIGVEESESHLAQLMGYAMEGKMPTAGRIELDVRWRE